FKTDTKLFGLFKNYEDKLLEINQPIFEGKSGHVSTSRIYDHWLGEVYSIVHRIEDRLEELDKDHRLLR
ncbi:hypothetical protein JXB11_01555, partial [Candidatus Woesearchaeota archaeon]|nr:hypothetical protein [Candidatus Woesearchaeota archaeon]